MMQSCPFDLYDLLRYVNETLDSKQRRKLEAHLEECTACSETLAALMEITPESTRAFFMDGPEETDEPVMPFPTALSRCIRLEQIRRWCKRLSATGAIQMAKLADTLTGGMVLQPSVSDVRSSDPPMIQMDIINLSGHPLEESRLQPEITGDNWSLSGFPAIFRQQEAWLLLIPTATLRELIPGWNQADSQAQLTAWLKDDPEAAVLPGAAGVTGFFNGNGNTRLTFHISESCRLLMEQTDTIALAVVII